jgi:hypothetical protein
VVARVDRVYPAGEPDPIERGNDPTPTVGFSDAPITAIDRG